MAKKKKAKKKATRKPAPRKKAATKKSASKSRPKARKPARKAAPKKSARKSMPKKSTAGKQLDATPKVDIWPYDATPSCDMQPHGKVSAPPKNANGQVNFHNKGSARCTIHFDNSAVFGTDQADLDPGDNFWDVQADPPAGQHEVTNVTIDGCYEHGETGPTDITVP